MQTFTVQNVRTGEKQQIDACDGRQAVEFANLDQAIRETPEGQQVKGYAIKAERTARYGWQAGDWFWQAGGET